MANWIAVAAADHVARGQADGFMQVCHGKAEPLRRVKPGDLVVYYSPTQAFGGSTRLQSFTALGRVRPGEPYQVDAGGCFLPYRRDISWLASQPAPISPLLPSLEFVAGAANWGYRFRFGLFGIGDHDMAVIAAAMQARLG